MFHLQSLFGHARGQFRQVFVILEKDICSGALTTYIDMDQEGLQDTIARLIAGESVVVDTDSFQNDVRAFTCRDDGLTLLAHLRYLTYKEESEIDDDDARTGTVRIPNEEVRSEFDQILRKAKQ